MSTLVNKNSFLFVANNRHTVPFIIPLFISAVALKMERKLRNDLDSLLEKNFVVSCMIDGNNNFLFKHLIQQSQTDVIIYTQSLMRMSKQIKEVEKCYRTLGPLLKKWICAFQVRQSLSRIVSVLRTIPHFQQIFSETKMDATVKLFIRKSSKILTNIFLDLMHTVSRYDPAYNQEFYCQWKTIMSITTGPRRANYFCLYAQKL